MKTGIIVKSVAMEYHHSHAHRALYSEIGQRIRKAREARGLTQQALASLISLTRTSITNIEMGRQKILLHTLFDLSSALGTTPNDLLPKLVPNQEKELESLLRDRPRNEREWIKSAVTSRKTR